MTPDFVEPARRRWRYVGPPDVAALAAGSVGGASIRAYADLLTFILGAGDDVAEPFTYVVDVDGLLRLAPRRSEHVACAQGARVLGAGEIGFALDGVWRVALVSNLSTGYCPDLDSWRAVAAALDRIGIVRPGGFTDEIVFRRCPGCGERNLVKEQVYVCALCNTQLPLEWNFATGPDHD